MTVSVISAVLTGFATILAVIFLSVALFFKRKSNPKPQPSSAEIPPYLCNVTNEGKLCRLTFCKNGEYHSFEFIATWSVDLNKLGEMIPK